MSEESMELVRTVHAGWARGDFGAGSDLLSPDFSWDQHAEAVEPGLRRGAEVGQSLRNLFEIWDDYRVEANEFLDAGDQVVVTGWVRGTHKATQIELEQQFSFVWAVRAGQLAGLRVFSDRREALEVAGL